jgi:hypothetical protein
MSRSQSKANSDAEMSNADSINDSEKSKHSMLTRGYSNDKTIKRAKILDKENLNE